MEHEVEGHRTAQHLRQVTSADGDFTHQPIGSTSPLGIPVAAALREVLPGYHAQAGGDDLHKDVVVLHVQPDDVPPLREVTGELLDFLSTVSDSERAQIGVAPSTTRMNRQANTYA